MLVSGGKLIAIDSIKVNNTAFSGDGVWSALDITNNIATTEKLEETCNNLHNEIDLEFEQTSAWANKSFYPLNDNPSGYLTEHQSLDGLMSASLIEKEEGGLITGYNGTAISAGKNYIAGDNILITTGEKYDTISVTGIKPTTYFATPYNRHTSSDYFNFNLDTLSANSAISYFNLSIGYKISTSGTIPNSAYSACIEVNDELVDTHYIIGNIPYENHFISKNIMNNNENKTYEITINKADELNISDIDITCVGYISDIDSITIGVLGTNDSILTFGNTVLRA